MTGKPAEAPRTSGEDSSPEQRLDAISLQQALIDFDVANARVMDLSQRLIEATAQIHADREALAALRREYEQIVAQYEEIKATKAFRMMQIVWSVRKSLHV